METVRFGRQIRALRRRRGWRQEDLAIAARVSRGTIGRIERGGADRVTVLILERLAATLGARYSSRLDWNGEALDRLMDQAHAALVEATVRLLERTGWNCAAEVSFNIDRERGSIDVLAWHGPSRCLLVVEVKSVIPDVQQTLVMLDRKVRLARPIARERGWDPISVSRLLLVGEDRTSRRRVAAHGASFRSVLPDGSRAARTWLQHPDAARPLGAIWFLTSARQESARHRVRARRARSVQGGLRVS